jgi:hypothetical protein
MLALVVATALAQEPCWAEDSRGAFRTCFDPGRGLELSTGGSAGALGGAADLSAGIRLRGERDSRSKADSVWLLSHRLVAADARLSSEQRHFRLLGYEGVARRHVDGGALVLPTNPPLRIAFPFDLGLYFRGLGYERRIEEGAGWTFETGRVAMLVDPLRSSSGRFHLGIGPTLAHQLRSDGTNVTNELTPLTALEVFVNAESEDGLWVFRVSGWAGWTFTPVTGRAPDGVLRARGELSLERVLVAINDQPISVALRASGAYREAGALAQNEWTAGAALKLQLFAHR